MKRKTIHKTVRVTEEELALIEEWGEALKMSHSGVISYALGRLGQPANAPFVRPKQAIRPGENGDGVINYD